MPTSSGMFKWDLYCLSINEYASFFIIVLLKIKTGIKNKEKLANLSDAAEDKEGHWGGGTCPDVNSYFSESFEDTQLYSLTVMPSPA